MKPASFLLAFALYLTACATQAAPTISAMDVQGTAVSSALTIVAMTQSFIPTSLPTETPAPTPISTPTPTITILTTVSLPSPTQGLDPVVGPTNTVDSSDCWIPLSAGPAAEMTTLRLQNDTRGDVTLTIFLNKTAHGDCGFTGYTIGKGQTISVSYPQGCYSFAAFINISPTKSLKSFGGGCANNPDKWVVRIGPEIITLYSP